MSKTHIKISQVYASEPDLLTREQKFAGGFVCNAHPDNVRLMRRAAKQLDIAITEGAPRRSAGSVAYVGIYTDIERFDPHALLQEFFRLLVERANARNSKNGGSHGKSIASPCRRRHQIKAAPHDSAVEPV